MIAIDQLTDQEFEKHALAVLMRELGADGLARFLRLNRSGPSDYTIDRDKWQKGLTLDQVLESIRGNRQLRFEDGVEGVVDLEPHLSFRGVFDPLRDPTWFAQVRVDPELGTVVWPKGADLDPDVLYVRLTRTPVL